MYGISNGQQKGNGGGGGAASYKAIKATLIPDDWEEVTGATPYFVGDDATTWAKDSDTQQPMKTNNEDLGIIAGQQYTITIKANGIEYSSTATAESDGDMLRLMFQFSETANAMVVIFDHVDWTTGDVGNGSATMVNPGQNTSLIITNFAGNGFGTTIQATISDSAIKVNSAVTMYTNTSEKISVGEKTDGSVTITAPSEPETLISYSLEIVGTDTEGLFELVNGYVPAAGITDYDGLQNVPIVNDVLNATDFTPVVNTYYRHTGETDDDYTKGAIYKCIPASRPNKPPVLSPVLSADEISEGVDNMINEFAGDYLPLEKTISNTDTDASTRVAIEGSASPYFFRISDDNVYASDFVRLYPMDEDTETWLNEHTLSSIITEELQKFTFKVDTPTLPTAYSFKYIIECR